MEKIYVKIKREKTLKQFFYKLYSIEKGFIKTYNNEKCTITQCKAGKHRSFKDLLCIFKTYYPSITVGKFINLLYDISNESNYKFFLMYCSTIKRVVIKHTPLFYNFDHKIIFNGTFSTFGYKFLKDHGCVDKYTPYYLYKKVKNCNKKDLKLVNFK